MVDGVTGLLVQPDSPVALARAVFRLYEHRDQARGMGLAGRRRIQQHFTVRQMVERYADLYGRLAEPARAGGRTG